MTGVKGKEKATVGEMYDLFESVRPYEHWGVSSVEEYQIASEIWPVENATEGKDGEDSEEDAELSIEDQIKKEMSEMKKPRAEQRFSTHSVRTCFVASD